MAVSVRENVYSSRQMSGRPERRGNLLRDQPDSWLMVILSGGNQSDWPGTLGSRLCWLT